MSAYSPAVYDAATVDDAIEWLLCRSHALMVSMSGDPSVPPMPGAYDPHPPSRRAEHLATDAMTAVYFASTYPLNDPWGEAAALLLDGWRPGMRAVLR